MKFFFFSLILSLYNLQGKAQEYKLVGNELQFEKSLSFKNGSAELNAEDLKILDAVKNFLNEKEYITLLRIAGNVSGNDNNQLLSEKRAQAAAQWLIKSGIDCKRLIAVGFGDTKPADQKTKISFEMAAIKNRLIGGMPADAGGQVVGNMCKTSK